MGIAAWLLAKNLLTLKLAYWAEFVEIVMKVGSLKTPVSNSGKDSSTFKVELKNLVLMAGKKHYKEL